jgi:hypothetical protein
MLSSFALVSGHPTPQSHHTTTLLAPVFGCASISEMASDDFCNTGCSNIPPNCPEDLCKCPEAAESALSVAGRPELKAPEPRIIGGWTNCPEEAGGNGLENESEDYLINYSHELCHQEEEDGEGEGHQPFADNTWGPSFKGSWGANAILPGKFGKDDVAPIEQGHNYRYHWVTVGGQGTDSADWQDTAEEDIINQGAKGCAFDEEGGVSADDAAPWIQEMREKHPSWSFVYVPECGAEISQYDPDNGSPDYIAPMMYNSNHDSYPRMDLSIKPESPFVAECLTKVHQAGWPAARTILTYQSFDVYRTRKESELMKLFGQLLNKKSITLPSGEVLQGPYAGALGWPSQCGAGDLRCWPAADEANLKVLLKAYKADKAKDALKSKKSSKGESLKSKKSPKQDEDVPPPHHA